MSKIAKWNLSAGGVITVLSTELNSISSRAISAASAAITNNTNLDVYVDIELRLAAFSPGSQNYIYLYILEAIDGSNYPGGSAAALRLTARQLLATILIGNTAATAQRVVYRQAVIPPGSFKVILDNQTTASLAASDNTVKFLPYNVNLNG